MKLISIKLRNFRQFYGKQIIDFASGDNNITIIFGENGKGKTGIYRALTFGLFGEKYLAQDNKKDIIHLVNFKILDENIGTPVDGGVEVFFEYEGKKYVIERFVQGYKQGNDITERILEPVLKIIDENGNYSTNPIEGYEKVRDIINNIMDEKIKDFFLFDGEKIETLAKTDRSVKDEVKIGIVKLLQIDKLDQSINILKSLYNKERKSIIKKSSNINLKAKEDEITIIENKIENLYEKINIKRENKISCELEIEDNEKKLADNEGIREIQEEIKSLKRINETKKQNLDTLKESLRREYFKETPLLMMNEYHHRTKVYLEQIMIEQQDLVPLELIEKSLKEMHCSCCGTNLYESNNALKNVERLKQTYKRSAMTPLIGLINNSIYDFNMKKEDINNGIIKKLKDIRIVRDEINDYTKDIEKLNKKKKDCSGEATNLQEIEKSIENKKKSKKILIEEINKLELQIEAYQKELCETKRQYDKLISQDITLKYERKKLAYIEKLRDSLMKIFSEYSDEMRNEIMDETTTNFKKLIDKKDKNVIESIKINKKYEIELYNWSGTKITQDISQGQRQIVSLAFITALAKVAAGSKDNINFPLFMDTPFGRISGNNRDNLIENIPHLTSQWILLLTDTEFTISEEFGFKNTGKLGAWYKLDQISPGHTNITKVDLKETMATRR